MTEAKICKKQAKSLAFRKPKAEREKAQLEKKQAKEKRQREETEQETSADNTADTGAADGDEQPKKKRKTRRGNKGRSANGGSSPRFLLFVGNLPYDIQQAELVSHFKNANPDRIRIRKEKGIAFLEFDNDSQEIQSKMDTALRMHHLVIRNRKINVELTVGGGGNSEHRQQKLKEKNEKNEEERKLKQKEEDKKKKKAQPGGMHPARAALLKS
ncbi:hypothetical protein METBISCDRAFT_27720 [Metschnikowia bicuspidata]|uniref:RRM domain-containing protein n=1 Tax=Metschnikowia bicuspidata TaxID=27322 RepID=A0A4P9ZDU4_9ASCO|nr:hypothetical protein METBISCDRAFT_27720 [Metschnikowia bicuspidata]